MTIHVIGSSGFVGRAIGKYCNHRDDVILYSSKFSNRTDKSKWVDLDDQSSWNNINIKQEDKLIFVSWRYLPNYDSTLHITENIFTSLNFLSEMIDRGVKKIICTGTCYEYGLKEGSLKESFNPHPLNCYSVAKDSLRRLLDSICVVKHCNLVWARIFYPYGSGQPRNSLIPSLDRAIDEGKEYFNTGSSDQVRDFINIEEVARLILLLTDLKYVKGIYNIGSGEPKSIKDFLEEHILYRESSIRLKLGAYPKRIYEPNKFWADMDKVNSLVL